MTVPALARFENFVVQCQHVENSFRYLKALNGLPFPTEHCYFEAKDSR